MLKHSRYHFLYTLKYIRYALALCVLPMLQALLAWDWPSLLTALQSDALILAASAVFAVLLWRSTGVELQPDKLLCRRGVLIKHTEVYPAAQISAVVVQRTLLCRITGGARVELYFRCGKTRRAVLFLHKADALRTAQTLLPAKGEKTELRFSGADRAAYVVLSANALAALTFGYVTVKSAAELLGQSWRALAWEQFLTVETAAARILPAGAAFGGAVLFVLAVLALGQSLLYCAGYRAARCGNVLVLRGGLLTRTHRRIAVNAVTACDMRQTPAARLLRRVPIFLQAGSFAADAPVLTVHSKQTQAAAQLLGAAGLIPPLPKEEYRQKSAAQYLWKPAAALAFFALVWGVSLTRVPFLSNALLIPVALGFALLTVSAAGLRRERLYTDERGGLCVCYARWFTVHHVYIRTPHASLRARANPLADAARRCNVRVRTEGGSYRVRGILQSSADAVSRQLYGAALYR